MDTNLSHSSYPQPPTATMSSLIIADITGKNHADVMRGIRNTLEQAEIGESKFAGTYIDSQNKRRRCYHLPRRECDLVISGYSVKYRLAIIDRWHELESTPAFHLPQSFPEALRLAADLQEQIQALAPKAEFYDRVTKSADVCQMAVAAQVAKLPFGRNTLFQKLRTMDVLFEGGERHNMPKQRFINQGLFTVSQGTAKHPRTGETIVSYTTHVTQKGLVWLVARFAAADAMKPGSFNS